MNAVVREIMASVATMVQGFPWMNVGKLFGYTRNSASQFQINSVNLTAVYSVGRRIRMVGSTTAYGAITSSTFSTHTICNVLVDGGGSIPTSLTEVSVCVLDSTAGFQLTGNLPASDLGGGGTRDPSFEQGNLSSLSTVSGGGTWGISSDALSGSSALSFLTTGQSSQALARMNSASESSRVGQCLCQVNQQPYIRVPCKYSGTAPGGSFVKLGCEFRSATGVLLSTSLSGAFTPTTSYAIYTIQTAVAPSGTAYAIPVVVVETGSPSGTTYLFDDIDFRILSRMNGLASTVASAAALALPAEPDVFQVSGTTNITSIIGGWEGRPPVTLIFQGILTVTDGGNLKLNGNFVTSADDAMLLSYSNGNWYEVSRSPN